MADDVVTTYLMDRAGPDANGFGDKLTGREGVELVGGADDIDDALTELEALAPAVVLVSTDFGGAGCVSAVESLLAVMPTATVVMLSSGGDKALVQAGMRAGAAGSLDRNASPGETITALHVHRRRQLGEDIDLALAEPTADARVLRVSGALPVFPGSSSHSEPGVEAAGFADPWRDVPAEPVTEPLSEEEVAVGDDMEGLRAGLDAPGPKQKKGFRLFGRRQAKSKDWGPAAGDKDAELQRTRAKGHKES